ncbi:2-oxo acid dehydrogenase subunit E2 [Xanthomonas oryzae]|uniref:2-oxo acid dehydrogenase subunit E2 n=1 Tax=Xanthomonas oryzae TaxID=347 RepID=UPI0021164709|nr:2-oxo acid dehydrogenase subunit E2 [Xanthomonas oryzae]
MRQYRRIAIERPTSACAASRQGPPRKCSVGQRQIVQQCAQEARCFTAGGGVETHKVMPLSLTFDHCAATGGEAARFLRALLDDLALAN